VRLGLVRREDDATDRRLVRNSLTTQGEFACTRLERGGELFTRRLLVEMHHDDLDKLIVGLRAFVKASEAAIQNEPNLAAVAMPGVNSE
jgi:DNA-binding MarR family transcriptional regulator